MLIRTSRGKMKAVMQSEAAECGLACVVMLANYHGRHVDLAVARRQMNVSARGASISSVMQMASRMGLDCRPLRAELDYLQTLQVPCILHWDLAHFVVVNKVTSKGAEIYDPARGFYLMPMAEVSRHFTGILIEVLPTKGFQPPVVERRPLKLGTLMGQLVGVRRSFIQVVGLAICLELLGLALPFQLQWVLDQGIVSSDVPLIWTVAFAFSVILAITTLLSIGRAHVITWLGASINTQWVTGIFRHLLVLPTSFFERRHMGDVVSRFTSAKIIQSVVTSSFAETVLDGLTGSFTLLVLFWYDARLTLLVLTGLAVYVAARVFNYRRLRMLSEEQVIYGARQQSELMESVRGIQAIKLANRYGERGGRLATATSEATEREMLTQRVGMVYNALNQGIFGFQKIALVALGGILVSKNHMSAGMLVAFLAYADQFTLKVGRLVDKAVDLRMLKMHAERLADITMEPPEGNLEGQPGVEPSDASLEARGLSFRYGEDEPWVFKNLSFRIEDGEFVAITGPSGCGKSTLAKVLLGLLEPSEGQVLFGGVDIRRLGKNRYRSFISAVMQDDQLFAGTLAQNIAFFDPEADETDIHAAARLAMVHDDIMVSPMRYETSVGDMGSTLSGGQKQRVLIARALYSKPRLLMLDEATSHLDVSREESFNAAVRDMTMTRVSIAHRPDTIEAADRVIELDKWTIPLTM